MADTDWLQAWRDGRLDTPFTHYAVIAEGRLLSARDGCAAGPAACVLKAWAAGPDEAKEMLRAVAEHKAFRIETGPWLYDTDPLRPPEDGPSAYDFQLAPMDAARSSGGN